MWFCQMGLCRIILNFPDLDVGWVCYVAIFPVFSKGGGVRLLFVTRIRRQSSHKFLFSVRLVRRSLFWRFSYLFKEASADCKEVVEWWFEKGVKGISILIRWYGKGVKEISANFLF